MAFRLAHFTDIHLTSRPGDIPWSALSSKRLAGWFNLKFLGRYDHLAQAARITRALLIDLVERDPDHILFTGDATGLSLAEEFEEAAEILAPLLDSENISGIAGNHDLYTSGSVRRGEYDRWLGRRWRDSASDAPPHLEIFGGELALIRLRDAHPRHLLDSSGELGREQLDRLEALLKDPILDGRAVILALHYGPLLSSGEPDSRHHGLRDAERLLEIVDNSRVDLVVHGHLHRRFVLPVSDVRPVPITTPGSLTYAEYDQAYHIYHVGEEGLSIEVRRFEEKTNKFVSAEDATGCGPLASRP